MRAAVLTFAALCMLACAAQNLTRRLPAQARRPAPTVRAAEPVCDTLRGPECRALQVSGFDKPLRAVRESMFVTNTSADSVAGFGIEITYSDMRGRQLHKASHDVSTEIPAGETRRVEVRSFDRSGLFHYRLSPAGRRAAQATPFDVRVRVTYILTNRKDTVK